VVYQFCQQEHQQKTQMERQMPRLPQMVSSEILLLKLQAQGEPRQGKRHPSQKLTQHESLDQTLLLQQELKSQVGAQQNPTTANTT
jgi:hypothetical protein